MNETAQHSTYERALALSKKNLIRANLVSIFQKAIIMDMDRIDVVIEENFILSLESNNGQSSIENSGIVNELNTGH